MFSRDQLETLATEVIALRPRVAELEEEQRQLEARLRGGGTANARPPAAIAAAPASVEQLKTMPLPELQALANEVFALRRRVVELEAGNRQLKMQVTSAAPVDPPVPSAPDTGFAFGIADATGARELVVTRDTVKLGKDASSHVVLPGARFVHAVIERTAQGVSIIDMGTAEGTLVNGERITKTMLASGDRLGIADAQLIVVFK